MFWNRIFYSSAVLMSLVVIYALSSHPKSVNATASTRFTYASPALASPSAGVNPASPITTTNPASFEQQVEAWIKSLSQQEQFAAWNDAKWTSLPLGPGQHGWVVLITSHGSEVGYMIIHAAPDGTLRLSEFGTSPNPLFSLNTLYQSLVQHELIASTMTFSDFTHNDTVKKEPLYAGAFYSLWKVTIGQTVYYADAEGGEIWPVSDQEVQEAVQENIGDAIGVEVSLGPPEIQQTTHAFDPYERLQWVRGMPLSIQQGKDLRLALDLHARITYTALPFSGKITVPIAVIGYAEWNGTDFVILQQQETVRFILLSDAARNGSFYP